MRSIVALLRLGAIIGGGALALAVTFAALGPYAGDVWSANATTSETITLEELALRSLVYDRNDSQFDVLYDVENRTEITSLDEVSEEAVTAIIVVEDEGFYEHNGIDAAAIARALVENVSAGGIEQGGSTITQQLVKNGVVGDEQVLERKIPEAALAMRLERQMEKDEILVAYLNTVYFGGGAYGIGAAAESYFNVKPSELTWPQAALLASLISNPVANDPVRYPVVAAEKRRIALGRLLDTGHITEAEYEEFRSTPLPRTRQVPVEWQPDGYFISEVVEELVDDIRLGTTSEDRIENLFAGGLRIYTTYDPVAQAEAESAVDQYRFTDERNFIAALAAVEPGTGYVRALVGGVDFEDAEFNIATQKGRPTGSSFKPFVLATAMEAGYVPSDQINGVGKCSFDNPGSAEKYEVENFGNSRGAVQSILSATTSSSNCGYVRLGQIVGIPNVIDTAHALGVKNELENVISLPLGPADITPLEMATAYATFANDGRRVDPIYIRRVEDRDGNVLLENVSQPQRAISEQSARLVTSILESNVRAGTGTAARLPNQTAAGKTGTAQDFADAWFVGYTPYLSTAVWVGNPDTLVPMRGVSRPGGLGYGNVTGGSVPAAIWAAFNKPFHEPLEPLSFTAPSGTRAGTRLLTDDEPKPSSTRPRTTTTRRPTTTTPTCTPPKVLSGGVCVNGTDPGTPTTVAPPVTQPPPPTTAPPTTAPPVTTPPTTLPPNPTEP